MSGERPSRIVKVGDRVTWGGCVFAEKVLEVLVNGVLVEWKGQPLFVAYDGKTTGTFTAQREEPAPNAWRLRFDNLLGDYVDGPASFRASVS